MNKLKTLIYITITSLIIFSAFSTNIQENQKIFNKKINDQTENKLYLKYNIEVFKIGQTFNFTHDIYFNKKKILENKCAETIFVDETDVGYPKGCEIPNMGDGNYRIVDKVYINEKLMYIEYEEISIYKKSKANIEFKDLGNNKTEIIINVEGEQNNLLVSNFIPKEVIEYIDEDNKDQLISANKDFRIIENDPLIAWSVDKPPARINYTINKYIDEEDRRNFEVTLSEDKRFQQLKILTVFLIIGVIFLIFRPMVKKDKKRKSKNK